MNTTRNTPSPTLPRRMLGITLLAGLLLLGALPHAAAQYFGSAIVGGGSTGSDIGHGIARDAAGNVYVTGHFSGTVDFDPGAGTANLVSAGISDIFVAKYTPTGVLIWAKGMGGTGEEQGLGIAVDASGNVLTTGFFNGTADFDPGAGTSNLISAGGTDIFVSKLDSSGNFVWASGMGGSDGDVGDAIAVDASGNVLTTGVFGGTADFDPGAGTANLVSAGFGDIFVSKLDSNGAFVFAKGMGSTSEDRGRGIAVDALGNAFTTGFFRGTADFDPGAGTLNLVSAGGTDIFVSKLDSSGDFVFAKGMGAIGADEGRGIALDASANVLTIGSFEVAVDFDPGAGTVNLTSTGQEDIFVSKLDSGGNFLFARSMGGLSNDHGNAIAVDAAGHVLITGSYFLAADFGLGAGTSDLHSGGLDDIFVSKLDSRGNTVFAKSMGGADDDEGFGIAVDPASANVFTTGSFTSAADFDPGPGLAIRTSAAGTEVFVSRLTAHSKVLWSQSGGPAFVWTVDGLAAYVSSVVFGPFTGYTATSYGSHSDGTARLLWTNPTSGNSGLWKLDANDAFVSVSLYGPFAGFTAAAYSADPEGSGRIVWTDTSNAQYLWNVDTNGQFVSGLGYGVVPGYAIKSFVASPGLFYGSAIRAGSTSADQGKAIARDAAGNLYVTGTFSGTVDFDPGAGTVNLASAGGTDIFVAKYTAAGALIWAKGMGGNGSDEGRGVAVDASGNVFTTGFFNGTADFDPGAGTSPLTSAGSTDIFVSKLDSSGNFVFAKGMGSNGIGPDLGNGIAVDASGNVLTTGVFSGTVDFDPGPATFNLIGSAGGADSFVSKLNNSGGFVFAKQLGSGGQASGSGIATDSAGNVFTTGVFFFTGDFDPGAGTVNLTASGSLADAYVSKLDSSGNFVFAKQIGGAGNDQAFGIAVDASGNVLTTGAFQSTADFDPGAGVANRTSAGLDDIYVSKLDGNGNFVFATSMGGTGTDQGWGIAVDAAGNALTTGHFAGTADFGLGAGSALTSAGASDIFVSKLDSSGHPIVAKRMGGTGVDEGRGIAADRASANVFTAGFFNGTADFDPGAGTANLVSAGIPDIFLSRLTVHSKVLWTKSGGPAIIWTVDGMAVFVSSVVYGPFSGYTATAYGSHRDGTGRLLWTNPTSGSSGLWKLDASDAFASVALYGPFVGRTAAAYTAAPDGSGRIVWTDASNGQSIWIVDTNGRFVSGLDYGVVPGFAIKSFVASP